MYSILAANHHNIMLYAAAMLLCAIDTFISQKFSPKIPRK